MLDSQYSRVIRWVNRAQTMSAGGKYSDAILDVECARAELDDARQELLLCHKSGSQRKRLPAPVLALITAFCAVLFMSSPLERENVFAEASASSAASPLALGTEAIDLPPYFPSGGARSSGAVHLLSDEGFSSSDVFHLIEVGRRALQKGEGERAGALDFN